MLLEGSELTKEDRESQLYDDFEHFRQHKEDSINDYYVRFSKLINDMRNIKMTMPKLQLNSEFENKMVLERLSQPTAQPTADPLALLSNVSNTQHGSPSSSTSSITPLPPPRANSTDDLIKNLTSTLALLT
nr:integrase, catalytic region, zinc finger, CCHC-type, peptidase aspartic, catalytic [Tanacetum cinerariifolium]